MPLIVGICVTAVLLFVGFHLFGEGLVKLWGERWEYSWKALGKWQVLLIVIGIIVHCLLAVCRDKQQDEQEETKRQPWWMEDRESTLNGGIEDNG